MAAKIDVPKPVQSNSPSQWIRLILMYLFMPLVLLVSGGDVGWWQAWVFSVMIVAAGVGGHIWAERRHPGLLAERENIERAPGVKPQRA